MGFSVFYAGDQFWISQEILHSQNLKVIFTVEEIFKRAKTYLLTKKIKRNANNGKKQSF
jgi:hypothetical protein